MKRIFAFILCFLLALPLTACGGGSPSTDNSGSVSGTGNVSASTNTDSQGKDSSSSTEGPKHVVDNMFMVCDRITDDIIVYNMDLLGDSENLDDAEVWRCNLTQFDLATDPNDYGDGGGALKYREDTVFGDVIVVACASKAAIIKYPEGNLIWKTDFCGVSTHSIEILPSGNVVCASANLQGAGNTIRLHYSSQILNGDTKAAEKSVQYTFLDAHGVLWDPEYDCLWAIGEQELVAYQVSGEPGKETLAKIGGMGGKLPTPYGHDLSADFLDKGYLYVTTDTVVYRFNKETGEFDDKFKNYAKLNKKYCKGFGNNPNGNFVYTCVNFLKDTEWEDEVYAGWSTNTVYYGYFKSEHFFYVKEYTVSDKIFYKARIFYGQYQ